MNYKGVIFDLDGVIVSTDKYHYQAWKEVFDTHQVYFDEEVNELLRGVSREESLDIVLNKNDIGLSKNEKVKILEEKNSIYINLLDSLRPKDILPGVLEFLDYLVTNNIKIAIGSSSKNARYILKKIELDNTFNVVIDGNDILKSKPDPEVFLKAARGLNLDPQDCVVIEDAYAGITAANRSGCRSIGVYYASTDNNADQRYENMSHLDYEVILKKGE